MSTVDTTTSTTTSTTPLTSTGRAPLALRIRRGALVALPVLAGVLTVVGAVADPAAGAVGERMFEVYADQPGALALKSLGYHWAYAFWIAPALLLARYVTGRGRWLADVAAVLGFAGMTTMPGMLFIDWVHSAVGRLWGTEGVLALEAEIERSFGWAFAVMNLPGIVALLVALPLAAVALWRGGLVRWWAPLAVVVGTAAFLVSASTWPGAAVLAVCFTVFAVAVERATREGATAGR